jgi:hypothetical protein
LTFRVMGGKSGKKRQDVARWLAKTAGFGGDAGMSTLPHARVPVGVMGVGWVRMRLSRCWRGGVAARSWN